ncbi:MAG: TIGR01212 family radical SAM protein [Clostridia bacterium]|nr:TIGR01212 family radical SAM protein [Clostridia bacterium]
MLYNNLSAYLREKYNGRIKKICIDGGFTCPNRDGKCGYGGCIFCGGRGSGDHITASRLPIPEQVRLSLDSIHGADGFIAYFQNYTNTYAPLETLRERYDSALIDDRIVILDVGTRPDCIGSGTADLLDSYRSRCDVWVELGLQTAKDLTAEKINRGYGRSDFERAVGILRERRIPVVVHIMIGLPGEGPDDVAETVDYVNGFGLWGIKIHSVYVMRGTVLEKMFLEGDYVPISLNGYAESAAYVLSHISPEMIVHRITGDCPEDLLTAPEWNRDKNRVISEINRVMTEKGWTQGCLYNGGTR